MENFGTPQPQLADLSQFFRQKCTLRPKIIHLRNLSQEKHVKRMQSAYQRKQIPEQSSPFIHSLISKPTRPSDCFKSASTSVRNVQNTDTRSKSLVFSKVGDVSKEFDWNDTFVHAPGDRREIKTVTSLTTVTKMSLTNLYDKNKDRRNLTENVSYADDSKKQTAKEILTDKINKVPNDRFKTPAPERQIVSSSSLTTDKTKDHSFSKNTLNVISDSKAKSPRSGKLPLRASEAKEQITPSRSSKVKRGTSSPTNVKVIPVTEQKTQVRRHSRIPLTIKRLASKDRRNNDAHIQPLTEDLKTKSCLKLAPNEQGCEETKLSPSKKLIRDQSKCRKYNRQENVKHSPTYKRSGTGGSNYTYTCSDATKSNNPLEASPNKDSSVISWLSSSEGADFQAKNSGDAAELTAKGSNRKKSTLSVKGLKLSFRDAEDSGTDCGVPGESDDLKNKAKDGPSEHSLEDFYDFIDTDDDVTVTGVAWNDDYSSSDNPYFSKDEVGSTFTEIPTTPFGSLPFLEKPLRYSTPYNLRFPLYGRSESRSELGIDDKMVDDPLNKYKTPKNKRKPSNKTPKHRKGSSRSKKGQKLKKSASKKKQQNS